MYVTMATFGADALAPRRVAHIDMPATPLAVWQALQNAQES
jgi:hypothetical protein